MKKFLKIIIILVVIIGLLALAIWFIPRPPGSWGKQEISLGYTGAFAQNKALDEVSFIDLGGHTKPEMVLYRDGYLYASVSGGVLLRMGEDGSDRQELVNTGGCILGFEFDAKGNILLTDCNYQGTGAILKIAADGSGEPEILINRDTGCELFYPNDLAIAADGTVYLTDSTTAFPPYAYDNQSSVAAANETMMHTCTGRVIAFNPQDGSTQILADGLAFANGIALDEAEKSLLICETYAYKIKRLDLASGTMQDFLTNIPGFPDNLTKGLDGRYWVGLNGERSKGLDEISDQPFLRKCLWILSKLSIELETQAGYSHVFAFTEAGEITKSLQSGTNGYYRTTGVSEIPGRLYISSINDSGSLAYLDFPAEN